jgi:ATP-dependent exoDNAse (exonuclease V) beta subunit
MEIADQAARTTATDVTRSVIVQAPAGSGKTTLLVERYLRLLATVDAPEQILAITFTRKAASEMQSRILQALLRARDGSEADTPAGAALARSRELGWQLLESPGRLKVQTIDSFALGLVRGLPAGSGFDPRQKLSENAGGLYRAAARAVLERLSSGDPFEADIADFVAQCDNDAARAERLLTAMLAKRDQWLEVVAGVVTGQREGPHQVSRVLTEGIQSLNDEVISHFTDALTSAQLAEIRRLTEHAAGQLGRAIVDTADEFRFIGELLTTGQENFRRQVTKREGFPTDYPDEKARMLALIEQLSTSEGMERAAANLRHLPPAGLTDDAADRLINVCITLALANEALNETFEGAATTDFTTLILNALTALGDALAPTELALALDYRIRHILVDEFQDTSVSQFRLFERLVAGWTDHDGNTFFAVGDPMQSIYRFRDADVSLFFRAWDHGVGERRLEPVGLTSNFRSAAPLVDWTNHTFGRVMGAEQDGTLGQIAFRPATATRELEGTGPAVELCLATEEDGQVQALITKISTLMQETDERIALLVRSRGQLEALLPALRRSGISWHANDIDPLLNKPVVRDLLNLVGVLERSADRLSWFSLLRSPLVGLALADLQALADAADFAEVLEGVDRFPLSASAEARLRRLAAAWAPVPEQRFELSPRSVIETLWLKLGGADAYQDPAALLHATRLLELVDDLGPDGLSMAALEEAAVNLFAADITDSALEILTIHKAKGLEFDHVLLPFLEKTTQSDEAELLQWRPLPDGLLMGIKGDVGAYAWLSRENRFREQNERQRLFYVACTRAAKSLTLFATETERPSASSLLGLLAPALAGSPGIVVTREPSGSVPDQRDLFEEPEEERRAELIRLKDDYRFEPPVRSALHLAGQRPTASGRDPLEQRREVVLGLVVHAALERMARTGVPERPAEWVTGQRPVWRLLAGQHELADEDVERIVDQTADQVTAVLADPDGRWILEDHAEAEAEFPLTAVIGSDVRNLVIDRYFVANGGRWVIDYKTGEPLPDEPLETFVQREVSRYRGQIETYAEAMTALTGDEPRAAIYFTALPRLVPV